MRKNLIYSAMEDKSLAYVCDEYRILNDDWYHDLEVMIKSNVCSEVTRQHDIMQALVAIQMQQQKSMKALGGGKKEEDKKETEEVVDELAYLKECRQKVQK